MDLKAKDIMSTKYHLLRPEMPVSEAISLFKKASLEEGKRVFGMMVTNNKEELVGMLSMYDILLYIRPKHINIWGEMQEIFPEDLFMTTLERLKDIKVGDIMTYDVVTVSPETHILIIIDIMIKKHIRRLPVVENNKILGIVYISDVFYELLKNFME